MDGSEVRELIQKWRALSIELEGKNKKLEASRASLNEVKAEYLKYSQKWELDKANINTTISNILEEVASKQKELHIMENETKDLQKKVEERMKRNAEYQKIISTRQSTVESKIKAADDKDMASKQRFEQFCINRDQMRKQLMCSVKSITEQSARETSSHNERMERFRKKITSIVETIGEEAKAWLSALGMRCCSAKAQECQAMLEEAEKAKMSKAFWTNTIQDLVSSSNEDSLAKLNRLESLLN